MFGDILNGTLMLGGRIMLAAVLGVVISYRKQMDRYRQSVVHAHAFLAMAGALLIMIIGDQIERAVGLIGVASIIRYRYAIRNPRDAGTLIISLGLGMASCCLSRASSISSRKRSPRPCSMRSERPTSGS